MNWNLVSYLPRKRTAGTKSLPRHGGHARSGVVIMLRPAKDICHITVVEVSNRVPVIRHEERLERAEVSPDVYLPLPEHLARITRQYNSRRLKTVVLLSRNDCYFSRSLIHSVAAKDTHETAMLQAESSFADSIQDLAIDYVALPSSQGDQTLLLMAGKHQAAIDSMRSQLSDAGCANFQILPEPAVVCLPLGQISDPDQLTLTVLLTAEGRLQVFAHQNGVLISHQGRLLSDPENAELSAKQICGELLRTLGALDPVAAVFSVPTIQLLPGNYDREAVQACIREKHPHLAVQTLTPPIPELPDLVIEECYDRLLLSGATALLQSEKMQCHNLANPRQSLTAAERRRQLITRCGLICVLAVIMILWRANLENRTLQEQLAGLQQQINELEDSLPREASAVELQQALESWRHNHALPQDLLFLMESCLPDPSMCRISRLRINRTNLPETPADVELEGFADNIDTVVVMSEALLNTGGFRLSPYQVEKTDGIDGFPVRFAFNLRALQKTTSAPAVNDGAYLDESSVALTSNPDAEEWAE